MLRPLVLVLKTMLNSYGLCDTYTGGLGSYSLTLMTIALLQVIYFIIEVDGIFKIIKQFRSFVSLIFIILWISDGLCL